MTWKLDRYHSVGEQQVFYVDAVNGSDDNNGTQEYPFKTIKKACESVSTKGSIYLLSDYSFSETDGFILDTKNIVMNLNNHQIIVDVYIGNNSGNNYRMVPKIHILNSYLSIIDRSNGQIYIRDNTNSTLPFHEGFNKFLSISLGYEGFSKVYYHADDVGFIGTNNYRTRYPLIIDSGAMFMSLRADSAGNGGDAAISVGARAYIPNSINATKLQVKGSAKLIDLGVNGVCVYKHNFMPGSEIIDENGNSLNMHDVVLNVIYDTNNIPRNIVSNYIF